jgi:hypothetical protein
MKSSCWRAMSARVATIVWVAPGSALLVLVVMAGVVQAAPTDGTVGAFQKISATEGGFGGSLDVDDLFGAGVASLGDVNGDGVTDVAVGVFDDDGGFNTGAVWILFLNADGTVKAEQKISETQGGFGGELSTNALFGRSVDGIGDLDGDGIPDLAVSNMGDDDGGLDRGALSILFLNTDGTVKLEQKISDTQGGFGGTLDNGDQFGTSVADIGDLDGDGVTDLAVGASQDDDGGSDRGAVWILFMNSDGTVSAEQKISDTVGGFAGVLDDLDRFGWDVCGSGDLDRDGTLDLTVAARWDDDGGTNRGAVWMLLMNSDGTVRAERKISDTEGGFAGRLDDGDMFGGAVGCIGHLDGQRRTRLLVGAVGDDDGNVNAGAVWILFLQPAPGLDINGGRAPMR